MTERPILFSAPMVRAIRDDSKTQTRRIVKRQLPFCQPHPGGGWIFADAKLASEDVARYAIGADGMLCPYGQPGDVKPTRFRDAAPPTNGWYWVRWTDADQERLVWLVRVPDEPQDDPPETEAHRWVWSKSPEDDPESIVLDIADPMSIEWRRPGDMLWVRETWALLRGADSKEAYRGIPESKPTKKNTVFGMVPVPIYAADGQRPDVVEPHCEAHRPMRWKPSIHMPRWASRITLEVLGVRVERLQDISEEDARAEGAALEDGQWTDEDGTLRSDYRTAFRRLRISINGQDSWDANPWVWVVEFRRLP